MVVLQTLVEPVMKMVLRGGLIHLSSMVLPNISNGGPQPGGITIDALCFTLGDTEEFPHHHIIRRDGSMHGLQFVQNLLDGDMLSQASHSLVRGVLAETW